jgi:hypothetical protein
MNIQPASVMHEGRPVRGVAVTCKCGVLTSIPLNTISGAAADQESRRDTMIARRLDDKGWKILKNKDGHSCPGCVARHEATKPNGVVIAKDFKNMKEYVKFDPYKVATVPVRASEEPQVDLDRLNRHIILTKLVEVYLDEKSGYSPGWTDAKVATDLGVPRSWVATLRNENFGPEGNEDIRNAVAEVKAARDDLGRYIKDAQPIVAALPDMRRIAAMIPHVERMAAALPESQRRHEKIERTIIETEKALRA